MRRARDDELRGGQARRDGAGRAHEIRQDRAQFVAPAARQQRDDRPRRIEAMAAQERLARLGRRRQLEQRMPDERHRHARRFVERRLERKDHQHAIGDALHRLQPAAAPGPELRADVVHDGHAALVQRARGKEIEIGKVDRDEDVGRRLFRRAHQRAIVLPRPGNHAQRFGEAGHREPLEVPHERRAGRAKAIAAEAGDHGAGLELQDLGGQRAGVQIAGRLAARDHHAQAIPIGHDCVRLCWSVAVGQLGFVKSPGGSGTLKRTVFTSRSRGDSPARRTTVWNGTWMPLTLR